MTCVTLCGRAANDADCERCLDQPACKEARERICWGCKRELTCPGEFKQKRAEAGWCRGRELVQR